MAELSHEAQSWLQAQLVQQVGENIKISMPQVDSRLSSRYCSEPLEFSLVNPNIQTQNSIRVQCNDAQGWQLYFNARVSKIVMTLISNRQLPAGSVITAESISLQEKELTQARGQIMQDPSFVVGARTKRSLNVGQIIVNSDLCLVCKGDVVTIEGISDNLVVSASGKALSDGALGENVRVQNLQSGRTVVGSVSAIKKIAIKL